MSGTGYLAPSHARMLTKSPNTSLPLQPSNPSPAYETSGGTSMPCVPGNGGGERLKKTVCHPFLCGRPFLAGMKRS